MGQHNVIELNGKRYDAVTGALLGKASSAAAHKSLNGRAIDGFIRSGKPAASVIKPAAHKAAKPATAVPKPAKKPAVTRAGAKLVNAHHPERAKTLMRHAVHKPAASLKPAIKTQSPSELAAAPLKTIVAPLEKKRSVRHVSPARLAHAKQIARSQHIRRFSAIVPLHSGSAARPLANRIAAVPRPAQAAAGRPNAPLADISQPASPAAHAQHTPSRNTHPQAPSPDIFEAAIAHAASHEQPKAKAKLRRKHAKLVNALAGAAAFLIIGGFVTYLNIPNIEVHVASMRAGFHAQLPGYKPTGYAMEGGVRTQNHTVAVRFTSGDSTYTLTQQPSDWDSQTLLDNYVALAGGSHKTIQGHGRTIYLYNGTNATWVNGGVRYDVNGNAGLTSDELVSLASSI